MPDILDHHSSQTTKAFILGKQGTGKTGAKASLIALGYKIRMLDFDNGADILRNLLTNPYYPYKKYMEDHNIPLRGALNYITLTEDMVKHRTENRFVPKSARAWPKMVDMLENWVDKDTKLGPIESWGTNTILDVDTFATMADCAYFYIQELNGRLGARREGFDYQRDVGGAQGILGDFLKKIFNPAIKCNVLINSHITWVDESKGISERPRADGIEIDPTGYPSAIGRALSPIVGKYFNNVFNIEQFGSGAMEKHEISTVPNKGIASKSSLPGLLKSRYPIETGLAEIFCALRGEPSPTELITACSKMKPKVAAIPGKIPVKTTAI